MDIQNDEPEDKKVLVILSARYMAKEIQKKLVRFLENGGRMILYGEVPEYDMEGHSCPVIMDALKLKEALYHESVQPTYFASMTCCGEFTETTASQPVERIQCFAKDGTEILKSYEDAMCGFVKTVGSGVICAVTGAYPADKKFWSKVFERMEICPAIEIDYYRDGIYASRTKDEKGQELFYLINLDCEDKMITVREEGQLLWEKFELGQKASLVLPRNVVVSGGEIVKSTAEITQVTENGMPLIYRNKNQKIERRKTAVRILRL